MASSLPDFLRRRFSRTQNADGIPAANNSWAGSFVAALASCVTIFVMCVLMLAEYSSLGSLFRDYVGVTGFAATVPTVVLAIVTTVYTASGGLYISIMTDRV